MIRSDLVFHDVVVDISRGDVDLTLSEVSLFRRTMNDIINPRGPLWAIAGFALWRRALPHSNVTALVAALYSYEASWAFHDRYPVASFFRDVALLDPKESALSQRVRQLYPRVAADRACDRRGVWSRVSDFVRLKRMRYMLFGKPSIRYTGIGSITCDFGPPPCRPADVLFVLGSKIRIRRAEPILKQGSDRASTTARRPLRPSTLPRASAAAAAAAAASSSSTSAAVAVAGDDKEQQRKDIQEALNVLKKEPRDRRLLLHVECTLPLTTVWSIIGSEYLMTSQDPITRLMLRGSRALSIWWTSREIALDIKRTKSRNDGM